MHANANATHSHDAGHKTDTFGNMHANANATHSQDAGHKTDTFGKRQLVRDLQSANWYVICKAPKKDRQVFSSSGTQLAWVRKDKKR